MSREIQPTGRELAILKILWQKQEATVREVYEQLREQLPIVQNTVQAFLRTMEQKGLATHRVEGRSFIYRATQEERPMRGHLVGRMLERVFDGAVDQLVDSAMSVKPPTPEELDKLEALVCRARQEQTARSENNDESMGRD